MNTTFWRQQQWNDEALFWAAGFKLFLSQKKPVMYFSQPDGIVFRVIPLSLGFFFFLSDSLRRCVFKSYLGRRGMLQFSEPHHTSGSSTYFSEVLQITALKYLLRLAQSIVLKIQTTLKLILQGKMWKS